VAKTPRRSPRRRPAPRSKRKKSGRKSAGGKNVINLKPLYLQIGRVLKQLEQLQKRKAPPGMLAAAAPADDQVSKAIARLSQHQLDFDDICGPTMEIPPPGAAATA
jgi:hypothetical protein